MSRTCRHISEAAHSKTRKSMHTFRPLDRQLGLIPASMALTLAGVDLGRGHEEAYRQQHPEALKTLVEIAHPRHVLSWSERIDSVPPATPQGVLFCWSPRTGRGPSRS